MFSTNLYEIWLKIIIEIEVNSLEPLEKCIK